MLLNKSLNRMHNRCKSLLCIFLSKKALKTISVIGTILPDEQLLTNGEIKMNKVHHKPAFERADEKNKNAVIQAGINEFSTHGFERANVNIIAKKAGVSVGLLYKYFDTKEDFFLTCVDDAMMTLEEIISSVVNSDDKLLVRAEKLIRAIQATSAADSKYVKLYNEITRMSASERARGLAERIETISSRAYADFLEKARENGDIRPDCDLRMFAFFFDSLLMTLQFSYTCDYYRERLKIYCGEDIFDDDEKMVKELLKFLESAFYFSHADIEKA